MGHWSHRIKKGEGGGWKCGRLHSARSAGASNSNSNVLRQSLENSTNCQRTKWTCSFPCVVWAGVHRSSWKMSITYEMRVLNAVIVISISRTELSSNSISYCNVMAASLSTDKVPPAYQDPES
jgi:hypothetical protein